MSGKPAARVGDMHLCPKIDPGPKPHVGGPILPAGEPTVLIGGMPAARVTDKCTCIGPPDTISKGSTNVFIGGKLAARMGDSTLHGGVILAGCPTVLIGSDGSGGSPVAVAISRPGSTPPPATMAELEARMEAATKVVEYNRARGLPPPSSPYSDDQKRLIAQAPLQEKFVVRVTKTQYATDAHGIGRNKTYWTTTYTQLEYADSDGELIAKAVGADMQPGDKFTLIIIDVEKASSAAGMKTFIPTYETLGDFAVNHLEDPLPRPDLVPAVMNEAYSEQYAELYAKVPKELDLKKAEDMEDFTKSQGLSPHERELFKTRNQIHRKLGANEHFLGNGITKDTSGPAGTTKLGAVETFTYDKNPQTLGKLERQGLVKRVNLK